MLWEDSFYESGVDIATRITSLVAACSQEQVAKLAIEARTKFKLRHVPLLLVREMARRGGKIVQTTLTEIIQRPDELTEFLAIYWKDGRRPIAAQVKKGLAKAFLKFNKYQLAKYNRDDKIKLRDVLFLTHAKPKDEVQENVFKDLVEGKLAPPDTWEVALSAGKDKKETFMRLMAEKNLGALAFLRNLRNMELAGVPKAAIAQYSHDIAIDRVLPFRFISAARAVPSWEDIIEPMMLRALKTQEQLRGKTIIVVDNSGSMYRDRVSKKSDLTRTDAAGALAILIREICEDAMIIAFSATPTVVPNRRGFALADAIKKTHTGSTNTYAAIALANQQGYDRIIVITDEQSATKIPNPVARGYFINVASYRNGIGYGAWNHIDGFSESVVDFIRELER